MAYLKGSGIVPSISINDGGSKGGNQRCFMIVSKENPKRENPYVRAAFDSASTNGNGDFLEHLPVCESLSDMTPSHC